MLLRIQTAIIIFLYASVAVSGQAVLHGDLVINEILFNPARDGYDYVEGYNRSDKTINLHEVSIASRNSTRDLAAIRSLARDSLYLPPGGYFVATANEKWLRQNYAVDDSAIVCVVTPFPSLPDDDGTAALINIQGEVIDELEYNERWHFALITDASGIALERIHYDEPTQDAHNWASASSIAGYGTPGRRNSQFRAGPAAVGAISIAPRSFIADNNPVNGFAIIHYTMKEAGYVATFTIYDASGKCVRVLLKNGLLGVMGQLKWDGLGDEAQRLPPGIYILATDIFNLSGKTRKFRNLVVIRSG